MSRIIVTHGYYGCDSGCCGHVIEVNGVEGEFSFAHPGPHEDFRAFAESIIAAKLGPDHVKDLDWEHCIIVDD